jgi:hypothetical protein
MKSDIDIVVESSRAIEQLLLLKFRTKGTGLVEQLKSIDNSKVSSTLDYVIRRIAHTRNAVVHRGIKLREKADFKKMVDAVTLDLNAIPTIEKKAAQNIKKKVVKTTHQPPQTAKKKVTKTTSQPQKKAKKKVKNTPKPIQYPPDFDPTVVDLKHGGTFGSDVYKKR